jgi:hypothetical protein
VVFKSSIRMQGGGGGGVTTINGESGDVTITSSGGSIVITTPTADTINLEAVSGGSGTVTSVAMTTPTGLTVTGSPITTAGTLAVTLTAGYVIPTQATLDNFVPYTGATGNVDLGTYDLITDTVTSKSSSGLVLENSSGGDVLHIGNGGGVNATAYGGWNFDNVTASRAAQFGASKTLESSSVTNTELGYVSGVTSAIQTQLNGKQATGNYITALTGDGTASGPGSAAFTLATVNSNTGTFGSSTQIPVITANAKGLITALSTVSVTIPSGSAVTRSITQASHGFAVREIVRLNGTSYTKSQGNNSANAEMVGMVSSVPDANTFTVTTEGYVTGLSGLTAGEIYFLSTTTAGAITTTDPAIAGTADTVRKAVFYADSTTSGYVQNYDGMVINPSAANPSPAPLTFQVMPGQLPSGISTPGVGTLIGGTSGERISTYAFDSATEEFLDVPVLINNWVSGDIIVGLPVVSSPASGSAPSYQTYETVNTSNTINKPSGTVENDLLIMQVRGFLNVTFTVPSGFTQIGTQQGRSALFYKVAGASEPASYTTSFSPTALWITTLIRVTGADTTNPINVSGVTNSSLVSPSVTTTVDNCLIMCFSASGGTTLIAPPGTLTSRYQLQYNPSDDNGTYYHKASMATKTQATLGASGTFTWTTADVGSLGYASYTVAIAPAAAVDPSYTGNTTLKVSPRVVTTDLSVTFNYATNAVTAVKAIGVGCNVEELTIPAASLTGLDTFKMVNLRISRTSASNTLTGDLNLLPQLISVRQ